jgi:hypothetical protein
MRRTCRAVLAVVATTAGTVAVGATPAPAAGPVGYTAVFVDGGCRIATVDISTGATALLSAPAEPDACVNDLAFAPDGTLWGIGEVGIGAELTRFDAATGAVLDTKGFTGDFSTAVIANGGIAFDAAGVLYVHLVTDQPRCDGVDTCLYTVDPATGATTFVGDSGQDTNEMSFLTADCAGSMVTSQLSEDAFPEQASPETKDPQQESTPREGSPDDVNAQNGLLFQQLGHVDPNTGVVTRGAEFPELFDLLGLEYERETGVLYALGMELLPVSPVGVFDDIGVYVVDPATADITRVADFDDEIGFPQGLALPGACLLEVTFTG